MLWMLGTSQSLLHFPHLIDHLQEVPCVGWMTQFGDVGQMRAISVIIIIMIGYTNATGITAIQRFTCKELRMAVRTNSVHSALCMNPDAQTTVRRYVVVKNVRRIDSDTVINICWLQMPS
jgi:hypothetical protein